LPGEPGDAMRAFLNRPDHLTRAALELSRLPEVEATARKTSLPPDIIVTSLSVGSRGQPAMLVSPEAAAQVTQAIGATITRARAHEAGATSDR
jgi:hypothetical protein